VQEIARGVLRWGEPADVFVEAGELAVGFPDYRGTSYYNMACAQALLGRSDAAAECLDQALAAGFADFDVMAQDSDLAILRDAGRLPLPEAFEYEILRHNRVEIPYRVLLPENYDLTRAYPAAVVFSPGGMGTRSTDGTMSSLWADESERAGWILVCAAQPSHG
jgi:hypothetical protein